MIRDFAVTYEIITPESAQCGDVAESGFDYDACTLKEAIYLAGHGDEGLEPNDSRLEFARWITAYHNDVDYRTGAITNRSIHFPDRLTPSTRRRICRLLCTHA